MVQQWWILPGPTPGKVTQSTSSKGKCWGSPGAGFCHARIRESFLWVLSGGSSPACRTCRAGPVAQLLRLMHHLGEQEGPGALLLRPVLQINAFKAALACAWKGAKPLGPVLGGRAASIPGNSMQQGREGGGGSRSQTRAAGLGSGRARQADALAQ